MRARVKTAPPRRRLSEAARRRFFQSRVWRRLTAPAPEELKRGAVLRFPAAWPYDAAMDCLLVEHMGDSGYALVISSGRKAGRIFYVLPREALTGPPAARTISRSWVIGHWQACIFDGCGPRDVMLADSYPAPR